MGEARNEVEAPPAPSALPRDLAPRAMSAAVLGVVAIGATWAGKLPFALMVAVVGLIMSWEWARIVRGGRLDAALGVHGASVAGAVVLTVLGMQWWGVAIVMAGALATGALVVRAHARMSALGVAYVGLPAIALVWLRGGDAHGLLAILFLFATVWTTDTLAYICGRAIGGPKLWPALSPRKTWSGTLGGIGFAGLAGFSFALLLPSAAPLALAVTAVVLAIAAQIGDLAESALKRAFDVKDASELIPGHGGFMDRMDGIVAAAAVAAVLVVMRGSDAPAQSLLYWS